MSLVEGGLEADDIRFLSFNWRRSAPGVDAEVFGKAGNFFRVVDKGNDFHLGAAFWA